VRGGTRDEEGAHVGPVKEKRWPVLEKCPWSRGDRDRVRVRNGSGTRKVCSCFGDMRPWEGETVPRNNQRVHQTLTSRKGSNTSFEDLLWTSKGGVDWVSSGGR